VDHDRAVVLQLSQVSSGEPKSLPTRTALRDGRPCGPGWHLTGYVVAEARKAGRCLEFGGVAADDASSERVLRRIGRYERGSFG